MSDRGVEETSVKRKTPPVASTPKGLESRKRVLLKAVELFADHGYTGVGLAEIGEAAGLYKGSLFGHFSGKRELYKESVKLAFEVIYKDYNPPDKDKSPQERLRDFLEWIVPTLSAHPIMGRLTIRMILDKDVELLREVMEGSFAPVHRAFIEILHDMKLKNDESALAFFVYMIFTLNDEMADFIKIWNTGETVTVGGEKSTMFIETLIKSW